MVIISISYREILESSDMDFIDFIIRGEGEIVFNELVKSISRGGSFDCVSGSGVIPRSLYVRISARSSTASSVEVRFPSITLKRL